MPFLRFHTRIVGRLRVVKRDRLASELGWEADRFRRRQRAQEIPSMITAFRDFPQWA